MVADSVSEQLLQRTDGLGGQFWLSKESVSTSATDCRILAPICTKYGLQKSVHAKLMDCTANVKSLTNTYIGFKNFLMGRLWPPKQAVASKRNKTGGCFVLGRPEGAAPAAVGTSIVSRGQEQQNNPESSVWAGRGAAIRWVRVRQRGALRWGGLSDGAPSRLWMVRVQCNCFNSRWCWVWVMKVSST